MTMPRAELGEEAQPSASEMAEWNERMGWYLFAFIIEHAGLTHHSSQLSHWAVDWCRVCETGRRKGEPCWYCETLLEMVG